MANHYLSAYVSATGDASLYWQRHDQCVALWRHEGDQVELVRYWELERLSGLKHHYWPSFDPAQRIRLLDFLVRSEGLTLDDITETWGLPDLGDSSAIVRFARENGVSVHSTGHLFSCLFLDSELFREGTLVALAIDGGPDFVLERRTPASWYCGGVVRDGDLQVQPVQSPGLLYTAATMAFGLEPGTLMAATSLCSCQARLESLSAEALDGRTFFGARDNGWQTATRLVTAAAAEARQLLSTGVIGTCGDDRLTADDHLRTVVMSRIQEIAEQIAVDDVRALLKEFDVDPRAAHLAMSGGSALNCPTNSRLLQEFGFRSFLCPPCANDGGQALGLGLAGLYTHGVLPGARFRFPGAYVGPADVDLEGALVSYANSIARQSTYSPEQFVADVTAAPVAWVDGASEIGPRALGHRSLLADPRRTESKDQLNEVKGRQWWRPVAPIVLEQHVAEWFEGGHRSPYMLETFPVAESRRAEVPAVVHLDGSARLQSLSAADDARLFEALSAFANQTGVPILCNTSLNAKGEPIVQSATEALEFCLAKGIRVAYVNGIRVELKVPAPQGPAAGPRPRRLELFAGQEAERDRLWQALESCGVGPEIMALIARAPQLHAALESEHVRRVLSVIATRTIEGNPAWEAYLGHLRTTYGPGGTFEGAFTSTGSAEDALMPLVAELLTGEGTGGIPAVPAAR